MYINTETNPKQYPLTLADIRAAHPDVGFPDGAQTAAVKDWGYALVESTTPPAAGVAQRIVEGDPEQVNGAFRQTWRVIDKTQEEIAFEQAALIKQYDGIVQGRLDAVARSFGYGDPNRPEISPILHAISYAEEPAVARFMNEGRALRAWRSLVWAAAAAILNAVKAGERPIPTEAELLDELPEPPVQDPLPT